MNIIPRLYEQKQSTLEQKENRIENIKELIIKTKANHRLSRSEKQSKLDKLRIQLNIAYDAYKLESDKGTSPEEVLGCSLFGRAIKQILETAVIPITFSISAADNHPYIAAGVVLGSTIMGAISAPIQEGMNTHESAMSFQSLQNLSYDETVKWCSQHPTKPALCAQKMINIKESGAEKEKIQASEYFNENLRPHLKHIKEKANYRKSEWDEIGKEIKELKNNRTLPETPKSPLVANNKTFSEVHADCEVEKQVAKCARQLLKLPNKNDRSQASQYLKDNNIKHVLSSVSKQSKAWNDTIKSLSELTMEKLTVSVNTTVLPNISFSPSITGSRDITESSQVTKNHSTICGPVFSTRDSIRDEIYKLFDQHDYRNATEAAIRGEINLCTVLEYAYLSDFPYLHEANKLPIGWSVNSNLTKIVIEQLGSKYILQSSGMVTTDNGFTAAVLQKNNTVCIAMGGTGSGDGGGNAISLFLRNPITSASQWYDNFKHALYENYVPIHYEQAANFTKAVKNTTIAAVLTCGHSLGGGLSSFAAAMAGTPSDPMSSYSYCSAQLGDAMHSVIADKCCTLSEAISLISKLSHFTIKGDPVDEMGGAAGIFANVSLLGKAYEFDPKSNTETWFSWAKSMVTENGVMLHGNYQYYINRLAHKLGANCSSGHNPPIFEPTSAPKKDNSGSWFGRLWG